MARQLHHVVESLSCSLVAFSRQEAEYFARQSQLGGWRLGAVDEALHDEDECCRECRFKVKEAKSSKVVLSLQTRQNLYAFDCRFRARVTEVGSIGYDLRLRVSLDLCLHLLQDEWTDA